MSRAQPQQARGFEFYPQQPQQQQPQRQLQQSNVQPSCPQYVASPRLPGALSVPPGPPGPVQAGSTGLYAEASQFADVRRPPQVNTPSEADGMRKELEKSRAQIAQLEKTLKWWSDCTANWREKWSKEKAERRKLKEELGHLRTSYDQTLARELERMKVELLSPRSNEENSSSDQAVKQFNLEQVTTGVGTGDTLQRAEQGQSSGLPIPTESTANFELQELLTETTAALEHERSENAELKSEVDRLTAEQNALKTELNLLKETISTIGTGKETESSKVTVHGLPQSASDLIDNLQSKVDKLEKDVVLRQMEHLNDWSIIDRLESERASLRAENDRIVATIEELEKASKDEDASDASELKAKELESLRADVHCLRRLVNRQTQELDHVNFLLSNQETETKLLRSRLLQPWGASAQRTTNVATTTASGSASTALQSHSS